MAQLLTYSVEDTTETVRFYRYFGKIIKKLIYMEHCKHYF